MKAGPRRREQTFTWEARTAGAVLNVTFLGEIDLTVFDEIEAGLVQPLAGPERIVLLDLHGVTFLDSTGLRLLIGLKQRTDSEGKQLLLTRPSQAVLRLFELTRLTEFFEYLEGHSPSDARCPVCDIDTPVGSLSCPSCGGGL